MTYTSGRVSLSLEAIANFDGARSDIIKTFYYIDMLVLRSGEESNERRKINCASIYFILHCQLRYSYRTPRIVPRAYLCGRAKSIFVCRALDKSGVIRGTQRIKIRSTTVKALSLED